MSTLKHLDGDRWQVRVSAGVGWQASRNFTATGKRDAKKQAETIAGELATELERRKQRHREMTDPAALTISALTELWLRSKRVQGRSEATMRQYETNSQRWVDAFGPRLAKDLAPGDVDRWVAGLALAPTTVRQVVNDFGGMLRFGNAKFPHDLPATPVTKAVDLPSHRAKRQTLPDQARFLAAVPAMCAAGPVGIAGALALGTAARQGSVCGLRWSDVDDDGWLRIGASVDRVGATVKGTKTGVVVDMPISTVARQGLDAARELVAGTANEGSPWVLPSYRVRGQPLNPGSISSGWPKVAAAVGLEGITFHGLRHAAGSMLLQSGVSLPTVSAALGHSNTAITARIYAHVLGRLPANLWESVMGATEPAENEEPSAP